MPWNFPFWQVIRFAAPHLMAGNGGVLKHASNVPGCALALEEIFRLAGFPVDLFRTVLLSSKDLRPLIEDPHIAAVTLTGSVAAGKSVAAIAGAVMKKACTSSAARTVISCSKMPIPSLPPRSAFVGAW